MAKVYVASPYGTAEEVRALHVRLRALGMTPTSSWAEEADGPEDFSRYTDDQLQKFGDKNDQDLVNSHAVLVWARDVGGSEMFAEARLAILRKIPVFWVGRRTLSAYRNGVIRCNDIEDALWRLQLVSKILAQTRRLPESR